MFLRGSGASVFTRTPTAFPAAMDRPPQVYPDLDPEAQDEALDAPGMMNCRRNPQGAARISERQCLINRARAAAVWFPSWCLECPEGAEVQARHPEGVEGAQIVTRHDHLGMPLNPRTLPPRQAAAPRQGEGKAMEAREIPRCPDHPGRAQKLDHEGKPIGACELCLQTARPDNGRGAPAAVPAAAEDRPAPRCPRHPENEQVRDKKGAYRGRCRLCFQEQQRRNIVTKMANIAARKAAAPPLGGVPDPRNPPGTYGPTAPEHPMAPMPALPPMPPGAIVSGEASLLAKLPDFDSAWSPEMQIKWLEVFGKLIDGEQAGKPAPLKQKASKQASKQGSHPDSGGRDAPPRRRLPPSLRGATDAVKRAYLEG